MKLTKAIHRTFTLLVIAVAGLTTTQAQDPLPSWNDVAPKKAVTNVLLGCVHLLLFGAYLMLMFDR